MTQPCPQQTHATMTAQKLHESRWEKDGTCSYCGSLSPERFFKALEAGCKLTPTDKSYKAYVDVPEEKPDELRVVGQANWDLGKERAVAEGWIKANLINRIKYKLSPSTVYFQLGRRGETKHTKFYFDHLNEDERKRVVDMINAKSINFAYPGHFYVMPFFVSRGEPVNHG